ncbi:SDR family oxidoreductase [Burkholderia sp. SCN-KJ]|uniref:SDR family oxidoreductase n=1 Tax=Burkholderia sp. SCN-KJ TaxID=2969248 RepID=UPI00215046B1|nr:SDR family oxidoreductase [Burkholderia sp. SCN-KJ]MCR4470334.1 SDR family oxidoreductase [Burkholderia sp. SCN-KJ]
MLQRGDEGDHRRGPVVGTVDEVVRQVCIVGAVGGGSGVGSGLHGERAGQGGKCGILAEGPTGAARGALAPELKPIRVNVVAPGFVDTPLYDAFGPEARDAIVGQAASALPGGRVGRADEVGEAIAFLLGNGFVNAEILHVDGGGRLV